MEQAKTVMVEFLGLTKKGAQNLAEEKNLIFRLIKVDDKDFFAYPDDIRTDRVCIEVASGKVVSAVLQ